MSDITDQDLEALSSFIAEPPPPVPSTNPAEIGTWKPQLSPTQEAFFNDPTPNILCDSSKGTGKSYAALMKIVRHCYEAGDQRKLEPVTALALIIVKGYNTGDLGVWYELENEVLPVWRDGNRYPRFRKNATGAWEPHPLYGELMDNGIGLEYTPTKLDAKTKASKIFIRNRFGTWSLIVLISVPYAVSIDSRMKGIQPSYIYVEEITDCESKKYHSYPSGQLNRRKGTGITPHQFTASCNPRGPSNWVYKLWFETKHCDDESKRDPRFKRYRFNLDENIQHIGPEYKAQLEDSFGDDYAEASWYIKGEWVDRPTGESIFRNYFIPAIHVKGDAQTGTGLVPLKDYPILVGHDPGPVNYSIHFMQIVPTKEKPVLCVFDELNFVGQYRPYSYVVPALMRRMLYWCEYFSPANWFFFEHIADESAFNQVRNNGKPDYVEIERESLEWLGKHPTTQLSRIKLLPCPKGTDTVPARVSMLISFLTREQIVFSAICTKTIDMLTMIESERTKEGEYDEFAGLRPKRCIHLHSLDSLTYPPFRLKSTGQGLVIRTGKVTPRAYECGKG